MTHYPYFVNGDTVTLENNLQCVGIITGKAIKEMQVNFGSIFQILTTNTVLKIYFDFDRMQIYIPSLVYSEL